MKRQVRPTDFALGREVLAGILVAHFFGLSLLAAVSDPAANDAKLIEGPALLSCVFACGIALAAPRRLPQAGLARPVRIWRRMTAFLIDVYLAALFLASVSALIALGIEGISGAPSGPPFGGAAEGEVAEFAVWTLALQFAVVLGLFWLHPKYGRATPGQYIMGYRIEPDPPAHGAPLHFLKFCICFFAMCSAHLWIWFLKPADSELGHYWWDRITRTRAVFVGPY